ncbi:YafY family protein [Aeromicrobium sp. Leaf350]|uniref:helix-turn-helix transcriptional regulator n=1 Tax=Aeromicrobium sp. Leaf350 TaxID=2876565 RepID=UPI001E43A868|nr:WYL domain-containing protein [Aeromicrobium sp. Leaf350]
MRPSARDVQRRLALVPYLQSKQGVSVDEVAREFGVKPRVIRKDVEQLMMTGVGSLGGEMIDIDLFAFEDDDRIYISNADFMTRPMRINAGEASALIVALRALRDATSGEHVEVVDSALSKLQTAVGGQSPESVAVVLEAVDQSILTTVRQGLGAGRRLEIVYTTPSRDAITTRQVDPIATFVREGHEYLDAWCHRAGGQRFFRLDRIERAEVLDVPVENRAVAPRTAGDGFFAAGDGGLRVELAVAPGARWVVEHYDAEILDDTGETWIVSLVASDEAWARRLALRSGGAVRVLAPDSARAQVTEHARSALAAYDGLTPATEEL